MAHLDDLIIRIKAVLDGGGFDQAADKVKSVGDAASNSGKDFDNIGAKAQSSFSQIGNGAGDTASNINKSFQSVDGGGVWENLKSGASSAWSSIKSGAESAASSISQTFSSIKTGISDIAGSMSGLDGAMTGILGGIGLAQVGDIVVGTSMKGEVNKVLIKNMTQTAEGADKLYKTVDDATNKSLISMQALIPAINGFKASTGATETQLNAVVPGMAQFGSYVYAMTGSASLAETAVFDLSKGIKGLYASLDQYGITEDALMRTGLWSGKEEDIEGYIAAVNAVTGSTEELMNTTQGMLATLQKSFSSAGKKLGEWVLPVIKTLINGFNQLNDFFGGNLAPAILGVVGVVTLLATGLGIVGAVWPAITAGAGMFSGAISFLTGALGSNVAVSSTAVGAAAAHASALGGQTVATGAATTSTWGLNTALLANPVLWVVVAIVALVAILWHLYNTNEKVREGINKVGAKLKEVAGIIWSTIGKAVEWLKEKLSLLWDKISNNPIAKLAFDLLTWLNPLTMWIFHFDEITSGLQNAWDFINNLVETNPFARALTWLNPFTMWIFNFDELVSGIQEAWHTINDLVNNNPFVNILSWVSPIGVLLFHIDEIIQMFEALHQAWNEFASSTEAQAIFDDLNAALAELEGAFNDILPALQELWTALFPPSTDSASAGETVQQIGEAAKEANPYIEAARDIMQGLGWVIQNVVIPIIQYYAFVFRTLVGVFKAVADAINWVRDGIEWLGTIKDKIANFNLGRWLKDSLIETDWIGVGVEIGTALLNGIVSMLTNIPILGDIINLINGGEISFTWPEFPIFSWPELPSFSWPKLPSFSWPKLPSWTWPKLPSFSWPKMPSFSWPSIPRPSWWSLIGAGGDIGAGSDEIGAGGDEVSSVSTSAATTKNSIIKNSSKKSSKKIVFSPVIKENSFGNDITLDDLYDGLMDRFWKEIEARG